MRQLPCVLDSALLPADTISRRNLNSYAKLCRSHCMERRGGEITPPSLSKFIAMRFQLLTQLCVRTVTEVLYPTGLPRSNTLWTVLEWNNDDVNVCLHGAPVFGTETDITAVLHGRHTDSRLFVRRSIFIAAKFCYKIIRHLLAPTDEALKQLRFPLGKTGFSVALVYPNIIVVTIRPCWCAINSPFAGICLAIVPSKFICSSQLQ